jgi:demethylmenaquinone methyltransferase/2-methoxy-6-polyprenyl-1,4-benzoquinol methylase
MKEDQYINALERTGRLSQPAIREAIQSLKLYHGNKVLDVPCGTGSHALWLLEEYPDLKITGVDIAPEHVEYAKEKFTQAGKAAFCEFTTGDMNKLEFAENTFELVWCCDGIWPGPQEMGCPAEEPYNILKDMTRITKPGGRIAVLFWSSQKLLPGYPLLEAKLNATKSAIMSANPDISEELHFMSTPLWMKKAGLKNIKVKTFSADIQAPFDKQTEEGLLILFDMFWGRSEQEVSKEIWNKFTEITNPDSSNYILKNENYAGFLTYTIFVGEVME